jgi:multiple sugar transport system permease protein
MSSTGAVKPAAAQGGERPRALEGRRAPKWPRPRKRIRPDHILFVLPAAVMILVFFVYPLARAFQMSFYEWPVLGDKTFVGLGNYVAAFRDGIYLNSLLFTAKYTLVVTPAIFLVALVLALLINNRLPGTVFFRSVYFLPVVISLVVASVVWLWIYNDLYGVLNYYLARLGLIDGPVNWMGQASTSLPAIAAMITWKTAGFTMVILLAGLQAIPQEVIEAAKTDGAGRWQVLRHITLPLLKPWIVLALVISVIGSVLAFEQFFIMTGGGPSNTTTTAVHWIYINSFKYFKLGYGSAMTFILLIILAILSLLQLRALRNRAEY